MASGVFKDKPVTFKSDYLQIYIAILSESSADDKQLNDELALAYISNSGIFPIGLSAFRDLSKKLSGGT